MIRLVNVAMILALVVIALGAYTRLTEAGLGCPDWPGCYGFTTVPQTAHEIKQANSAFPNAPIEHDKAWNEMIHRYAAGILGLVILALFTLSLFTHQQPYIAALLLLLVIGQAILGMLTVTENLQPIIVISHLLGGFTIFTLLMVFRLKIQQNNNIQRPLEVNEEERLPSINIRLLCLLGLIVLIIQIALGGWTSANYAAIVCTEFPICNGNWLASYSLGDVFQIPPQVASYQYGVFDGISRMNIHITHRLWAVVTFIVLLTTVIKTLKQNASRQIKVTSYTLLGLLITQIALGVSNILFQLPISIAVAHNLVALMLLTTLLTLTWLHFRRLHE